MALQCQNCELVLLALAGSQISDLLNSATTWALVQEGHKIWTTDSLDVPHAVVVLGKVLGDLNGQVRTWRETGEWDFEELAKELGNLVTSSLRALDELGIDVDRAMEMALDSQRQYVTNRGSN